ncbi:Wadjet anti-phage system protein JetA family protein [Phaeospirillum tilakii]|uniref:Wadjet anti-phage system protein JetA family protein n=1 Tax=Phaeospirillum tilakii TaxID=741673 RepID=A0ABW5C9Z4_9PROT
MPLFGHLDDSIFLLFSRGNRHLYAEALLVVYRQFFGGTRVVVPLRDEVIEAIARLLRQRPDLWQEAEEFEELPAVPGRRAPPPPADEVGRRAHHAYGRLLRCGWIEEEPHGFNAVVEMPPAAMALADQLDAIDRGLPQLFGGVVIDVKTSLEALALDPTATALGLPEATANAVRFTRRLRAILSSLRAVQRAILASPDLKTRLEAFFEDFIGRILVADYKATFSYAQHPLRFRADVARMARSYTTRPALVEDIAQAYVKNGICPDLAAARRDVFTQLDTIAEIFEGMGGFVSRIEHFRVTLERRLRNTVRYMDRSDDSLTARLAGTMRRLDRLRSRAEPHGQTLAAPSLLTMRPRLFSPAGFAQPRAPRAPLRPRPVAVNSPDPIEDFRERLSELFEATLDPDEASVAARLDRIVPPGGTVTGERLAPTNLTEFALLETLLDRLDAPDGTTVGERYRVAPAEGRLVTDWIEGPNLTIGPATPGGEPA